MSGWARVSPKTLRGSCSTGRWSWEVALASSVAWLWKGATPSVTTDGLIRAVMYFRCTDPLSGSRAGVSFYPALPPSSPTNPPPRPLFPAPPSPLMGGWKVLRGRGAFEPPQKCGAQTPRIASTGGRGGGTAWSPHRIRLTVFGRACAKGHTQVNKALHTCTSWYAYAAMCGSSVRKGEGGVL